MVAEQVQQLGPYRVDRVVGEGGFGVVYAASRPGRDGALAVKVLREDLGLSDTEVTRFLREAEALASVHHPAIVEVVDYGRLPDGRPYLAMPLLEGTSLSERLEVGPLAQEHAVELFLQLAAAVEALHRVELVHRDIKPDNVMLVDDAQRALLLDLGIAKRLSEGPSTTTQAGLVRGTPAYMAPERFYGKPASTRSDAYELALVFYVMLVGAAPWDDPTDPMARHRPRPLSAHGLPPVLGDVVMRALSADPKLRPPSVAALAEGVKAAAGAADVGGPTGALTFTPLSGASFRPPAPDSQLPPSIGVDPTELATVTPEEPLLPERMQDATRSSFLREAAPTPDRTPPPSTALPQPRRSDRKWFFAAAGGALIATTPWLVERLTRPEPPAAAQTTQVEARSPSPSVPTPAPPGPSPVAPPIPPPSATGPASEGPEPRPVPPLPRGAHPLPRLAPSPPSPSTLPTGASLHVQPLVPRRHLEAPSCDAWIVWACSPDVSAYSSMQCATTRDVVGQSRAVYEALPGNELEPHCAKHFALDRARVSRHMDQIAEREAKREAEKARRNR